jgi:hypothetical protein
LRVLERLKYYTNIFTIIFLGLFPVFLNAQESKGIEDRLQVLEEKLEKEIQMREKLQRELEENQKEQSKSNSSGYVSPLKTGGLTPDYLRNYLLDPIHAKQVRENQDMWLNDILRLGFMIRPRYESRTNLDFNKNTDDYISRTQQASAFWILIDPNPYLTAKVTIQDARVWGGSPAAPFGDRRFFLNSDIVVDRNASNRVVAQNSTFVREAFVVLHAPDFPIQATIGRQVLMYGDQRILGGANWNSNGHSFDGVNFQFENKIMKTNLFVVKQTEQADAPNGVMTANGRRNGTIDDSYLLGFYHTFKLEALVIDLYNVTVLKKWVARRQIFPGENLVDEDVLSPDRIRQRDNLHTTGFRITNRTERNNLPKGKAWDYTWETAFQSGLTGQRIYASWDPSRDENGRTYNTEKVRYVGQFHVFQTGYTFFEKLRLAMQYSYSSGDRNRRDGSHSTFQTQPNPRFSVHPYWNSIAGLSENMNLQNVKSYNTNISYNSENYGYFTIAYFIHRKAKREDAWYAISGDPNTGAGGSCNPRVNATISSTENCDGNPYNNQSPLGAGLYNELDFSWMYNWRQGISFFAGVGILQAGDSIRNARNNPLNPNPMDRYTFRPRGWMFYFMVSGAL